MEVRAQVSAGGYVAGRFYIVDETLPAVAGLIQAGYLLPVATREVVDGYPGRAVEPGRLPGAGVAMGMVGSAWEGTQIDGAGEHLPHEDAAVRAEDDDASGSENGASDS